MMTRLAVVAGVALTSAAGVAAAFLYRQHVQQQDDEQQHHPTSKPGSHSLQMEALPAEAASSTPAEAAVTAGSSAEQDPLAVLGANAALFSAQERELLARVLACGQQHLVAAWPLSGEADADKRRLVAQLGRLDGGYPGGLPAYINNARRLLAESRAGVNPFEGFEPQVPGGVSLDFASPTFLAAEAAGLRQVGHAAFVLVAGGLGERLGYSGIKVALPTESATGTTFLGLYCTYILALQERCGAGRPLPLAIMTSDDTHQRTLDLLAAHDNYGMAPDQITLLKQEKVACLADNEAALSLSPSDPFTLETKPHGHGDVHALLHSSGTARAWHKAGVKWVCFFQDTNALVFRALLVALGVSSTKGYDMNSLAVPRKAKEAIGAIARLVNPSTGQTMTVNVEYNQLDPLMRATGWPQGDTNDPQTGYSPFPGNINQLVVKLSSYLHQLEATWGVIGEFVNPKYKDASKTAFKSSTRLECMMQDYPKGLPPTACVGFTVINQVWATYSPVKNSAADARAKAAEGNPTHSATTGEFDIYACNARALALLTEAEVGDPQDLSFNGIPLEATPRVVLCPSFAPTLQDIKDKIAPRSISLSPGSVLVLEGEGLRVTNLRVSGALVARAAPGAAVTLDGLAVSNEGWEWRPTEECGDVTEVEAMRGFRVVRHATHTLTFDTPGTYRVPPRAAAAPADQQEQKRDEQAPPPAPPAAAGRAEEEAAAAAVSR